MHFCLVSGEELMWGGMSETNAVQMYKPDPYQSTVTGKGTGRPVHSHNRSRAIRRKGMVYATYTQKGWFPHAAGSLARTTSRTGCKIVCFAVTRA